MDSLLKYSLGHDPCREGDRVPSGAVAVGTSVRVLLRVNGDMRTCVYGVQLLVGRLSGENAASDWREIPLDACDKGFVGTLPASSNPQVSFYAFRLELADGERAYYVPRADGRSTAGEVVVDGEDGSWTEAGWRFSEERLSERPQGAFGLDSVRPGFQVTSYEPEFTTPEWLSGSVMYQIFPDRFARGTEGVLADGLNYRQTNGRPTHVHESWDESPQWVGKPLDYDPVEFYGGTISGICEKLPYLASLGVEVLYLNPVFEARSNHRYDTANYECIDPLLGGEEDFSRLAEKASELGISIVLDAVLSHTGADSRYFKAAQAGEEPFSSWYDFSVEPYRCWWGDPSLPEVNEHDASWQDYILGRVLPKWIAAGARGYRLDVADEIPDEVLGYIRESVKGARADAAVIGEVWEDPTVKASYGNVRDYALGRSLDSVMNYPLRDALIGFALGRIDAHQLAAFCNSQQANYPAPMHRCLMNLLSTHDVERVLSVLATGGPLKNLPRDEQLEAVRALTPKQERRADALERLIVSLLFALPGMPCIYYGDERGMHGGGDPFCRAPMRWSDGEGLVSFYQEWGMRRKRSAALRGGSCVCVAPHEDVVCVIRSAAEEVIIVSANRSNVARTVAVELSSGEIVTIVVPACSTTCFTTSLG